MSAILGITITLAGISFIVGSELKISIILLVISLLSASTIQEFNPSLAAIERVFSLYTETVFTIQLLIVAVLIRHYTNPTRPYHQAIHKRRK